MHGNDRHIAHLWSWNLLLALLLQIWGFSGTAAWHHLSCLPMSPSTPHPVLGFWELLRGGTGCASQGRSATGEEVHIISLQRGVPADAQVTLVLGPDPLPGAPIFLLHSQEPVHWTLPSLPGKNWTFQVSPASSISVAEPMTSAKETKFPQTPRELLKWARREFGGVTSLAEYHGVNTVYIRLGADSTAPATCKLRRNFLTSAHFASERQLRPLRVCLNPDPPQELEVHIIFSKGPAPKPSLAHLTVELHAAKRTPQQGLLLILKSEGAAQWMVRAHRLTGQLHVLASHKVVVSSTEADSPLMATQRTSPGLAHARDPLQYAAKQKLPAFTSYTEAERVNRFLLLVGLNEATAAPREALELASPLLPPRRALDRQNFPEAATTGWDMGQEPLGEDGPVLPPVPVAQTEGVKPSSLCPAEGQEATQEKEGPQKVSCVSSPSTQASSSEATVAFQGLPFHHGNVLLSLEVYSSEALTKQPGPCTVSTNSHVFVECLSKEEACKGGEEWANGRFQRIVTKPMIVTVKTPLRAALPGQRTDHFLAKQQGKVLKNAIHARKTQPAPTAAAVGLELPAVVGIAFSAFIIGMSLTGGIWFIHSQIGDAVVRRRRSQGVPERGPEDAAIPKSLDISSALTAAVPARRSQP
ncbi:hypothetical protein JRQ81_002369 [Phrynocephalus forsythii]|uniref:TGFBR3/Endoglin-like N-terminal domain-containing protein n=1 Tax=Phrynocephalus forsythii TaxID=171643 RepID=A0A9Q0XI80_9SAUR|nr:hypothetical protein JRQ81_002369 [Phrynocephalus forsythii]